jgi:hypothetical protein
LNPAETQFARQRENEEILERQQDNPTQNVDRSTHPEDYLSAFKKLVSERNIPMYEFAITRRNGYIEPREDTFYGNLLNVVMNYEGIKSILSENMKDRFHEDWNSFVTGQNMSIVNNEDYLENMRRIRRMNKASAEEYFRDEIEQLGTNTIENVVDEDEAFSEINMGNEEQEAQRNENAMLTYPQIRNADNDESNANYDESDESDYFDEMVEDDD